MVEKLQTSGDCDPESKSNLSRISSIRRNDTQLMQLNISEIDSDPNLVSKAESLNPAQLQKNQSAMMNSIRKMERDNKKAKSQIFSPKTTKKSLMIKKDIVKYFARIKQSTSSYFYFKKRNPGVMNYIFKEHSGKCGPFGDLRMYFGDFKNFKNKQLAWIQEINRNLLLILAKDQKAQAMMRRSRIQDEDSATQERDILDFHNAFKSITHDQKYDIDSFIDKNSYFSKSIEEIKMLFKAFQQPDMYKDILRSFNLSEEIYLEPGALNMNNIRKEREEIIKNIYLLIHDIHKSPELPELNEPVTRLEAIVSPDRGRSQAMLHARLSKFNQNITSHRDHMDSAPFRHNKR